MQGREICPWIKSCVHAQLIQPVHTADHEGMLTWHLWGRKGISSSLRT